MTLNEKQQLAAQAPAEGAIRINAGAGTGKTTTLLKRIDHLFKQAPGNILLLAFNKSVVEELTVKVEKQVNVFASGFTKVATSYGFAFDLVKKHYTKLGFTQVPEVPPEYKVVKAGIEEARVIHVHLTEAMMKGLLAAEAWRRGGGEKDYGGYINRSRSMQEAIRRASMDQLLAVSDRLARRRRKENWVIFQDMLPLALELPSEIYADLDIVHLLVDEAQDLHVGQHGLIHALSQHTRSLTVVGDIAQAIYAFAGARPDLFKGIPARYDAKDYILDVNYRSKQPILDLANKLLEMPQMQTPLRLKPNGEQPGPPVQKYKKPEDIVFWMQSLIDSGVDPKDIAVIFRTRAQTRDLEFLVASAGIPYTCTAGSFFDHPVVDEFVSYYKLLMGQPTEEVWVKVAKHRKFQPTAGIESAWQERPDKPWQHWPGPHFRNEGQKHTWREMKAHLDGLQARIRTAPPSGVFADLHQMLFYQRWADKVAGDPELEREYNQMTAYMHEMLVNFKTGAEFYDYVTNRPKEDETGVSIISGHKSKGLEWPYVAIWSAGDGSFPLSMDEDELRLLYVAVTRAQNELALFPHKDRPDGGLLMRLAPDPMGGMKDLFRL